MKCYALYDMSIYIDEIFCRLYYVIKVFRIVMNAAFTCRFSESNVFKPQVK